MRDKYPEYKRGELDLFYSKLPKKDKEVLDNFILSCKTSVNENKAKDIRRCVLQLRHITNKTFDALSIDELRHFLVLLNQSARESWTKHDIKAHVKRFLKWHFKDWSERFNSLKELKNETVGMNEEKINEQTLLTKEEIETVMKKENNIQLKTFFIALYESGMRPSELRRVKWENIKFNVDGELTEINVFMTKNKKHKTVYVKDATFYLKKLQNEAISDYVFYSRENKDLPIADNTATRWINELSRHLKNKHIYPYLLRHTRSQELYTLADKGKLGETVVQKFLGHSKSMRHIYAKMSNATMKEAVTKTVYNFEELPIEKRHELEKEINLLKTELKKDHDIMQSFLAQRESLKKQEDALKEISALLLSGKPLKEIASAFMKNRN